MNPSDYIGKPWEASGRGPESFDCWGLLVDIYEKELGIKLPTYPEIDRETLSLYMKTISGEAESKWEILDEPVHLCAVGLSRSVKFLHHVGIYDANKNKVLHAHRGSGVVFEPLEIVQSNYNLCKFYGLRS